MNHRNVVFGLGVSSFGLNRFYREENVDCSNISLKFYKKFIKGEENIVINPECLKMRDLTKTTKRHKEKPIHDRIIKYMIDNNVHYNKYESGQTCFYNDTNIETIIENPDILDNKKFVAPLRKKLLEQLPEKFLEENLDKIVEYGDVPKMINNRKFSKGFHERNQFLLNSGSFVDPYFFE